VFRNARVVLRGLLVAYIALVVGPMLPLVVPGRTWVLFAGGAVVGALGGVVLVRSEDATRVFTKLRLGIAALLPLAYLVAVYPAVQARGFPGLLGPATAGVVAVFPGYLAFLLRAGLDRQESVDAVAGYATERARMAAGARKQVYALSAVLLAFGGAVGYLLTRVETGAYPGYGILAATAASLVVVVAVTHSKRELTVTDEGLLIQGRLHSWDSFAGFEFTREHLVLRRTTWWRTDSRLDTQDMENPRKLYRALSKFLERD
jgi:hypothetical protein